LRFRPHFVRRNRLDPSLKWPELCFNYEAHWLLGIRPMTPSRQKVFRRIRRISLFLILTVIAYLLSYGPALSLAVRGYLSPETIDRVYTFHGLAAPDQIGVFWMQFDPLLEAKFRQAVD